MSSLRKVILAASALALSQLAAACTHLDKMESDFAQTWETPPVQVNPSEPVASAAMTDESFADLGKKLAGMSVEKDCRSIVRISARMLTYKAGYAPAEQKWADCDYHER